MKKDLAIRNSTAEFLIFTSQVGEENSSHQISFCPERRAEGYREENEREK